MTGDPTAQGWCTDTALLMERCATPRCAWFMFSCLDDGRLCLGCRAAAKRNGSRT